MSDTTSFLASVPLLEGIADAELAELAAVLRTRILRGGDVIWREGEAADAMHIVVEGSVAVSLSLPGNSETQVATVGPGEVLGEIPLLDGGRHSGTARATERTRVLLLNRSDFAALVSRRHATAFALKRRFADVACARLRAQLAKLAASLGEGAAAEPREHPRAELEPSGPPDSGYVRRLADFRAVEPLALWGFLTAGRYVRCPAGRTLIAENEPATACFVTMNGAVERVIVRGGRRIRVGLAGPGRAFGHESLIDGAPSPVAETTRERALLLVVTRTAFEQLYHGETGESHLFLDVILRDLMASLRQALRPQAHLASRRAWAADPPGPT